jgi:hypothetical protein
MNIFRSIINFFKKIWFYIKTGECDEELDGLTENMDKTNSTNSTNLTNKDQDTVQIDFYQIYKERL